MRFFNISFWQLIYLGLKRQHHVHILGPKTGVLQTSFMAFHLSKTRSKIRFEFIFWVFSVEYGIISVKIGQMLLEKGFKSREKKISKLFRQSWTKDLAHYPSLLSFLHTTSDVKTPPHVVKPMAEQAGVWECSS